jgi:hypothetical protein
LYPSITTPVRSTQHRKVERETYKYANPLPTSLATGS